MNRAFSLAEVIIATGILGAVILMVAGLFPLGMRAIEESDYTRQAMTIGRNVLERIQSQSFSSIKDFNSTQTIYRTVDGQDISMTYEYRVTVTNVSVDVIDVLVEVQWKASKRVMRLKIETRVYNNV